MKKIVKALIFKKLPYKIAAIWYNTSINSLGGKMAKTANLYAKIEPDVKEQAEIILDSLGIPASNAISMFYKQIILNRGIPFELKLPAKPPIILEDLTEEGLNRELMKGYSDITNGNKKAAEAVFDKIQKDYCI